MFLPKTGVLLASVSRITSKLSRMRRSLNWTLYRLKRNGRTHGSRWRTQCWADANAGCGSRDQFNCDYDPDMGYEFCDLEEEKRRALCRCQQHHWALQATLDAYTYAHPEWMKTWFSPDYGAVPVLTIVGANYGAGIYNKDASLSYKRIQRTNAIRGTWMMAFLIGLIVITALLLIERHQLDWHWYTYGWFKAHFLI